MRIPGGGGRAAPPPSRGPEGNLPPTAGVAAPGRDEDGERPGATERGVDAPRGMSVDPSGGGPGPLLPRVGRVRAGSVPSTPGEGAPMTHPRHALDDLITHPVRFSIVATLAAADTVEFRSLRDLIEDNDSTLSKQVSALEQAGYVEVRKGYVGKRPRTWLSLSARGRRVFRDHVAALRAIVGDDGAGP
jgi:DNA-binding MarR family transcriptional regulator